MNDANGPNEREHRAKDGEDQDGKKKHQAGVGDPTYQRRLVLKRPFVGFSVECCKRPRPFIIFFFLGRGGVHGWT